MKTLQRLKASPPKTSRLAALALASTLGAAAFATEGGGSTYPLGTENFVAGAAPPPGLYVLEYVNVYSADRVNDAQGQAVPIPGFKVNAVAAYTLYQRAGGFGPWGG